MNKFFQIIRILKWKKKFESFFKLLRYKVYSSKKFRNFILGNLEYILFIVWFSDFLNFNLITKIQ